jgi:hypothetical protein
MPLNETLMAELKKRYGAEKGEAVYWGMAGEGKGPFGPKGKYRAEHEAIAAKGKTTPNQKVPGKKKPPPPKKRGLKPATRPKSTKRRRR